MCSICEGQGVLWVGHGGEEKEIECSYCNGTGLEEGD